MKKWAALFTVLVMALSLCACKKNENTSSAHASTAPVKTEEKVSVSLLTKAKITDFFHEENEVTDCTLIYDEDYNLLGAKMYQGQRLVCEITYDKDPSRPLVEQTYNDEGNKNYRVECTYNANGDELSYAYYYGDELGEAYHYTYDEHGKLLTETYSDTEIRYAYDAEGNILSVETYRDGQRLDSRTYTYRDGKLVEESYVSNGYWSVRTYDAHGNVVTVIAGDEETLPGEETVTNYHNTYADGKLVEAKAYQDDVLVSHRRFDSAGNETLYVSYMDEDGAESYREEADYDENGRLIRYFCRYDEGWEMCGENTTTYSYGDDGMLCGMRYYSYEKLLEEYIPIYETVTVSAAQAEKIAKVAEKIYLPTDDSEC